MEYEALVAEEEAEKQSRQEGVRKIEAFLKRLVGEKDITSPEIFAEAFLNMKLEQFISVLETLNGVLKQIPKRNRELLSKRSVITENYDQDWINLCPPKKEASKEILKETFNSLQNMEKDQEFCQHLAMTIYNLIIYLHLFPDGNGRTARLVYFLTSPRTQKSKETFERHLNQILTERSPEIDKYHRYINYGFFLRALEERGISDEFDDKENSYYATLNSETCGFDKNSLGYLAAIDSLSDDEKKQYGKISKDNTTLIFKYEDFPTELQERVDQKHEEERIDFTKQILKASEEWNDWPNFIMDPLDKAFEVKEDSENP